MGWRRSWGGWGVSFFLFFGSLGVFASFDGKLQTTSRKPNKNNKTNVFFCFLEVFATFGGKPGRHNNMLRNLNCSPVFVLNISSTSCYISTLAHPTITVSTHWEVNYTYQCFYTFENRIVSCQPSYYKY